MAAYASAVTMRGDLGWNALLAQGGGFVVGTIVNYPLCRKWVFVNRYNSVPLQLAVFVGGGVAGLGVNEIAMAAGMATGRLPFPVASAIGLGAAFVWNFGMNKAITFGQLR